MAAILGEPGERVTVREECSVHMGKSGTVLKKTAMQERALKVHTVVVLLDGVERPQFFRRGELRKEEAKP